jgi:flagellar protein FlaG
VPLISDEDNGGNMSTINSQAMMQAAVSLSGDTVSSKPVATADSVNVKRREVSANTEKVNAQIAEQRSEIGAQMGKMKARLEEAIKTLNASVDLNPNELHFSVDSTSNRIMVIVKDEMTGETVRQIPGEAVLRVAHNIESMKGLLFDKVL